MKYEVNDIHAHVVPSIDDGASDLNMSIELLRMAHEQGVRNVACTSHSNGMWKQYCCKWESLRKRLKKENIDINIYFGCEIYCNMKIVTDIIYLLNNNHLPTLNHTKYVLIEFSPYVHANEMLYCIKKLHIHGYRVILAHVERYRILWDDEKWISLLQNEGCLFQINAYSLEDESNKNVKNFARKLLAEKRVAFVGSDAHRMDHRPYVIKNGIDYIYLHCDVEYAKDVCYRNAKNILNME